MTHFGTRFTPKRRNTCSTDTTKTITMEFSIWIGKILPVSLRIFSRFVKSTMKPTIHSCTSQLKTENLFIWKFKLTDILKKLAFILSNKCKNTSKINTNTVELAWSSAESKNRAMERPFLNQQAPITTTTLSLIITLLFQFEKPEKENICSESIFGGLKEAIKSNHQLLESIVQLYLASKK